MHIINPHTYNTFHRLLWKYMDFRASTGRLGMTVVLCTPSTLSTPLAHYFVYIVYMCDKIKLCAHACTCIKFNTTAEQCVLTNASLELFDGCCVSYCARE